MPRAPNVPLEKAYDMLFRIFFPHPIVFERSFLFVVGWKLQDEPVTYAAGLEERGNLRTSDPLQLRPEERGFSYGQHYHSRRN